MLRRLLESRMGRRGKREFVFDAIKQLMLCRMEGRPQRLDLELYPYLPKVTVTTTLASDYMALMSGSRW